MGLKESERVPGVDLIVGVSESLRKEFERETISSFLDLDLYKLTMGQFVFRHFPHTLVGYEFINRTKAVKVADLVPREILSAHLGKVRDIKITDAEIDYLERVEAGGRKLFGRDYLQFLEGLRMPPVSPGESNGQYKIEVRGPWASAIYWETLILSTVNELCGRALLHRESKTGEDAKAVGRQLLSEKTRRLKGYISESEAAGFEGPYIMDFGTRRRFSGAWQEEVVRAMRDNLGNNFIGTSNVKLGMKLDMPVKGTFAHEMDMILSGIFFQEDDEAGRFVSHEHLLDMWYQEYGEPLSIALTDTYGSDYFFEHFSSRQAKDWLGLRQDSGDPEKFAEKSIRFYVGQGIDPGDKYIVFSDGLDVDQIISLHRKFRGRIKMIFGWGTTLTNDVGLATMSLVVKATEANGFGIAKLSDNVQKAVGKEEAIERVKKLAGYANTYSADCRV